MANDPTYQPKTYRDTGGDKINIASGGIIDIQSGGKLTLADVDYTTALKNAISGLAAGTRVAFGIWTTVAATDVVATGLTTVTAAITSLVDSPVLGMQEATATTTGMVAGSFLMSGFGSTSNANPTPVVAVTFGKHVAWFAWGT